MNLVSFNSSVTAWQPHVVDVTESNLRNAWNWVKALTCYGTTNTLDALQLAFKDTLTKAVYLLTDGRPDHVSHTPVDFNPF